MDKLLFHTTLIAYIALISALSALMTPPEDGPSRATLSPDLAKAEAPAPLESPSPSTETPPRRVADLSPSDRACLKKNLYWEARGEGYAGMELVAKVTLNRVKSDQWPDSVCDVVRQPRQFSWTHQVHWDHPLQDSKARQMAEQVLDNLEAQGYTPSGPDSTWAHHYVRKDIQWKYAEDLDHLGTIGDHHVYS